ncbi:MAG: MFS transporter [Phycisphaerales bacterium]|nr:MAG: MFS transporter [Phycisphaerales bacterium]
MPASISKAIHETLTSEDDGRVCRDIPEEACQEQPRNFTVHVASLTLTKAGDGLADPKLTLAWLLTALGAPAGMIGLLVPVREAGSLLPQLVTAGVLRKLPVRKWAWALGSVAQALALIGIAATAFTMEGPAAGAAIIGLLAVFAVARSVCSVTYKDVLGKTVSKATRGTATGSAATASAGVVLAFGALLSFGIIPLTVPNVAIVLLVAAGCWLAAAALFATLAEAPGSTEGGQSALRVAVRQVGLLRTDAPLRRFIVTRGLLTATALAPPYVLAMSGVDGDNGLGRLGPFLIASATASLVSSYIWGRMSDRSSRRVMILAGVIGAATMAGAAVAGLAGVGGATGLWLFPTLLFVLMIAHQGVRVGRATHIVDMATEETRAAYTALSNTAIGVLLLAAGATAAVAQRFGFEATLLLFAGMSALAALSATRLDEAQRED